MNFFYKNLVSIFLKLLIENLKENIMVNEYINKIDFASCLNVSEKKISLAIEKFNEKQKDQFIDKNKILLFEDSLNIFQKIFVENINETEFIIFFIYRSQFSMG